MQNLENPNSPRFLKVGERAERLNKLTALAATQENEYEATKDRDELTQDSSGLQQQLLLDHGIEQTPTHTDLAPTTPAGSRLKSLKIEFGVLIL